MIRITPDLLAAATGCRPTQATLYAAPLAEACAHYGIDATPQRLAAFLAQLGHESGGLQYVRELASGEAYEGRTDLGNTEPGDGERYKGRGLIQVTGRANYRRMAELATPLGGPDFEAEPQALEVPHWAAWSAAAYWHDANLNARADAGEFDDISSLINTGRRGRVANGNEDRQRRHRVARVAIGAAARQIGAGEAIAPEAIPAQPDAHADAPGAAWPFPHANRPPRYAPAGEADPFAEDPSYRPEAPMPIAPIVGALLPTLIEAVPKLGKLFGSGSAVAERNVKAAELAMSVAQQAVGAVNAQEAVERVRADPVAARAVAQAVESRWLELVEAGGDGISGARRTDAEWAQRGDMLHSPSFWVTLALLPLVYLVVGSVVGLWGGEWPSDVRAAIATAVVSLIVGGAAGYYWGQTTSRNRNPGSAP